MSYDAMYHNQFETLFLPVMITVFTSVESIRQID